jgi:hypothetical protein
MIGRSLQEGSNNSLKKQLSTKDTIVERHLLCRLEESSLPLFSTSRV